MRTEVWTDWEGHVINGTFPLQRFIGGSHHSAVFLSEYAAQNLREVAIKFVPADNLNTEAQQLVQWGAVATLSHPRLVRLFDVGRCQLGGRSFLFAVMEYAEQTLAEILPKRPLTMAEVLELLPPTLEGLGHLHRHNLVHGQLKPSNIMVVNDQIKLATDTVRSPGAPASGFGRTTLYDPPELRTSGTSAAGDIWALGITLVEALTQRYPVPDERSETPLLPAGLPPEFVDTVKGCLSRSASKRPSVRDLEAQYQIAPTPAEVPVLPAAPEASVETAPEPEEHAPKKGVGVAGIAAVVLICVAAWVGLRYFRANFLDLPSNSQATPARNTDTATAARASAPPAERELQSSGTISRSASQPTADEAQGGLQSAPAEAADETPAADGLGNEPSQADGLRKEYGQAEGVGKESTQGDGVAKEPQSAEREIGSSGGPAGESASAPTREAGSGLSAREPTRAVASESTRTAGASVQVASTTSGGHAGGSAGVTTSASGAAPPADRSAGSAGGVAVSASRVAASANGLAPSVSGAAATTRNGVTSGGTSAPRASSSSPLADGVHYEVVPEVPQPILNKIRGHVVVGVRVLVDPAGNVVGQLLENAGPSHYFARLAGDAAAEWKFAPTDDRGARVWRLRFEFTHAGATVQAAAAE